MRLAFHLTLRQSYKSILEEKISHLILFIEVPLKAAELRLMHLSWASSILPMEVVVDVVAALVVGISLLLWVRVVGDVRDVGVAGLLKMWRLPLLPGHLRSWTEGL